MTAAALLWNKARAREDNGSGSDAKSPVLFAFLMNSFIDLSLCMSSPIDLMMSVILNSLELLLDSLMNINLKYLLTDKRNLLVQILSVLPLTSIIVNVTLMRLSLKSL